MMGEEVKKEKDMIRLCEDIERTMMETNEQKVSAVKKELNSVKKGLKSLVGREMGVEKLDIVAERLVERVRGKLEELILKEMKSTGLQKKAGAKIQELRKILDNWDEFIGIDNPKKERDKVIKLNQVEAVINPVSGLTIKNYYCFSLVHYE